MSIDVAYTPRGDMISEVRWGGPHSCFPALVRAPQLPFALVPAPCSFAICSPIDFTRSPAHLLVVCLTPPAPGLCSFALIYVHSHLFVFDCAQSRLFALVQPCFRHIYIALYPSTVVCPCLRSFHHACPRFVPVRPHLRWFNFVSGLFPLTLCLFTAFRPCPPSLLKKHN